MNKIDPFKFVGTNTAERKLQDGALRLRRDAVIFGLASAAFLATGIACTISVGGKIFASYLAIGGIGLITTICFWYYHKRQLDAVTSELDKVKRQHLELKLHTTTIEGSGSGGPRQSIDIHEC